MQAFLRVSLLLLPLPVYLIAARLGWPMAGALAGLALAVAVALARHGARVPPPVETGLVAGLFAASSGLAAGLIDRPAAGEALVMAGLAIGAAASLWRGQPWTAAQFHLSVSGVRSRTAPISHLGSRLILRAMVAETGLCVLGKSAEMLKRKLFRPSPTA